MQRAGETAIQASSHMLRSHVSDSTLSRHDWLADQQRRGKVVIKGATGATWSLEDKLYTPYEVVNLIDENTANILEFIGEWGEGDFTKLLQYTGELRDSVSDVLGYVRRTDGKLVHRENTKQGGIYHYPFTDGEMGKIVALTLQILTVMSRMEMTRESVKELDDLLDVGESVGLALGELLSNRDDGDALRRAVSAYKPPTGSVLNWINFRKPGPKPTEDAKQVRAWLRLALIDAYRDAPSQDEAYVTVKKDLEARADQLEGLELGAFKWLQAEESNPKADPCGTLWRDIRRKTKTNEEKPIRTN